MRFRSDARALLAGLLVGLAMLGPGGCVFLPETTVEYDPECDISRRHMVLRGYQVEAFYGCRNEGCIDLLILAGAVTVSSVVISGSVAVVGDIVYWLEATGRCARRALRPE